MGGWIAVLVLCSWFAGFSGVILWLSIRNFRRWRKSTSVSTRRQATMILLPSLLVLALFAPGFAHLPDGLPVPMDELKEITAPVESVKQFTTTRSQGRGGVTKIRRYRIYLKGASGCLYIPENFSFKQEQFLDWAGTEPVTFQYALTGGDYVPYVIRRGDGGIFWNYFYAADRLQRGVAYNFVIGLSGVLLLEAGAVALPGWIYPSPKDRRGRWSRLAVVALFLLVLVLSHMLKTPAVTETHAAGSSSTSAAP